MQVGVDLCVSPIPVFVRNKGGHISPPLPFKNKINCYHQKTKPNNMINGKLDVFKEYQRKNHEYNQCYDFLYYF